MKSMIVLFALAAAAAANPTWGHAGHGWNNWAGHGHDGAKWYGPLALPPGYDANGAPLPVQDTPEVAAEKAAQLSVLAHAGGNVPAPTWNAAHGGWAGGHGGWAGAPGAWAGAPGAYAGAHGAWAGAPGAWAGHGAGVPHDTPEVAAAKAAHFAAVAAASHGGHGHRYRRSALLPWGLTSYPGSTSPLVHAVAAPVVRGFSYHTTAVSPLYSSHWW